MADRNSWSSGALSTIIHGGPQFLEQWITEYYNTWWTSLLGAVEHCNWEFVSAGYNWY